MAPKASKLSTNGTETVESALKNGAEAVKSGFEKAAKGYDQFVAFGKENAEAVFKSANVAGKGFETLNAEVFTYSRRTFEEGVTATKAMLASKNVHEILEIQSGFAKSAVESYVAEITKCQELALAAAKEAAEPIQARVTAFVDLVQSTQAA